MRAARERTAGWAWPLDKNDAAYDPDVEPSSSGEEDDETDGNNSSSSTARGVSSSSGPVATVAPLTWLRDYYGAMGDQPDLKFLAR